MQVVDGLPHALEVVFHRAPKGVMRLVREDREMRQAGDGLQAAVGDFAARLIFLFGDTSPPRSPLRMVSFVMRIFSVLVTMTLNESPRMTGMSGSPSRVKMSFTVAAKCL